MKKKMTFLRESDATSIPEMVSTADFAALFCVQPATVRRALCVDGHYMGITPIKMPNDRLLWPKAPALRLREG